MNSQRKRKFSWDLIGNIDEGRPNLGHTTRIEIYRLMQYTLRDKLEEACGTEQADKIFYDSGHLAGCEFYANMMEQPEDLDHFVRQLQNILKELKVGILRVEEADLDLGRLVLTVSEDLDCSGLPELDEAVCTWDEGFIAGLLESFTGSKFTVREVDCWCTGDRTCRFTAEIKKE